MSPATGLPVSERVASAWRVLAGVPDPEVPAVSVRDLGIVRDVIDHGSHPDSVLEIVLTPTYSGCPATEVIEQDVIKAINTAGLGPARVTLRRAPAWTTDWISAEGRRKMLAYGIVPPGPALADGAQPIRFFASTFRSAAGGSSGGSSGGGSGGTSGRAASRSFTAPVLRLACPRCGSANTEQLSAFGSTACKSTWRCLACLEPFEHFKAL